MSPNVNYGDELEDPSEESKKPTKGVRNGIQKLLLSVQSSLTIPPNKDRTDWRRFKHQETTRCIERMMELYWHGVTRDIDDVLRTLSWWRHTVLEKINTQPEDSPQQPADWLGLEAFVRRATRSENTVSIAFDILKHLDSLQGQEDQTFNDEECLARMLIRAIGILDIDKVVEHNPPVRLAQKEVWARPRATQLTTAPPLDSGSCVEFKPLVCHHCGNHIRGSHYRVLIPDTPDDHHGSATYYCETCTRDNKHGSKKVVKMHKRCILGTLSSDESAHLECSCLEQHGQMASALYPFTSAGRDAHERSCPLVKLKSQHEKKRRSELKDAAFLAEQTQDEGPDEVEEGGSREPVRPYAGFTHEAKRQAAEGNKPTLYSVLQERKGKGDELGTSMDPENLKAKLKGHLDPKTIEKLRRIRKKMEGPAASVAAPIVPFAASLVGNIPYGNVHVGLMIGPLIIENGVPDSRKGALITVRDRLQLLPVSTGDGTITDALALSNKRVLWAAKTLKIPRVRRVKTFMKQIVGSPFWNSSSSAAEAEFIKAVTAASYSYDDEDDEPLSSDPKNESPQAAARSKVMDMLKSLINPRVEKYLCAIVGMLFDKHIPLEFHHISNPCQRFCEAIIDRRIFGSFMVNERICPLDGHGDKEPLYLLSFVSRVGCHDGSPRRVIPVSKFSDPNGHVEEYLLRYRRFGHHNDTDVIDSLTEYWTDWGGFQTTIYPHQDLFPWDCTEARSRNDHQQPVNCGKCQLAKHLWAFPFDSWSINQLHFFRARSSYPPNATASGTEEAAELDDDEWKRNRVRLLEAQQVLGSVAAAMHRSKEFRKRCRWDFEIKGLVLPNTISEFNIYESREKSKLEKNPASKTVLIARGEFPEMINDRVKLAGIHRAQPKSHVYEHGEFHDCTLADWADLQHDDQVAAYEELRDSRASGLDSMLRTAAQHAQVQQHQPRAPLTNLGHSQASQIENEGILDCAYDGSQTVVEASAHDTGPNSCACICDISRSLSSKGFGLNYKPEITFNDIDGKLWQDHVTYTESQAGNNYYTGSPSDNMWAGTSAGGGGAE